MEQSYQQIANTLVDTIPEDWQKILLYAEYREGYKKIFFYYYPKNGTKPVYSLDIPDLFNVNENMYEEFEDELYQCFTRLWAEFKEQDQEQWTHLTFILNNTGKMKIDYGYDNIAEISPVEKQEKWEAKYLK
ncbi:immunity protein YezG family protein [Fictibacillus aquaticus]|uniref:Cytoplasmic protein n=1 Tax=Fictibacillus aquaticus TaxID=2021314 RepID=A0A235F760_9BACL|nr:immunity protein YezG family protein [Fictibacillus aquaticus]OYD57171.1 cytoplasmic protein [Fictibacillus aquaticus]